MVAPPAFRPDLEPLGERVLPALLSLSAPVSALAVVRVAPVTVTTPAVDLDARVAVNLNASLGAGACAPYYTPTPSPCPPAACPPSGGLLVRVAAQASADLRLNAAVGAGVRVVASDINLAAGLSDTIAVGLRVR